MGVMANWSLTAGAPFMPVAKTPALPRSPAQQSRRSVLPTDWIAAQLPAGRAMQEWHSSFATSLGFMAARTDCQAHDCITMSAPSTRVDCGRFDDQRLGRKEPTLLCNHVVLAKFHLYDNRVYQELRITSGWPVIRYNTRSPSPPLEISRAHAAASGSTSDPPRRGRIQRLPDSLLPCLYLDVQRKQICVQHVSQAQQS
jgi:hypothetical protein